MTNAVEPSTLYVVATPIGNLGDISPRAVAVLNAVDVILCEDTRETGVLLKAVSVQRPKEAFHQHNTMKRIPAIIDRLQQGESFALVSDRGMPTVSDPGAELVAECHRAEIAVSVIPGPSALTVAFAGSGYPHPFVFWGFLPSHGKERRMAIDRLATNVLTQIIYEAPHRLEATLSDLRDALGGGHGLTIARELTKPYEEFWQGPIDEALSSVPRFRGELVLVLAPLPQAAEPARLAAPSPALWQALEVLVEDYIREGQSESEAIRRVAAQFRVARRALYERVVRAKQVTD